MSFFKFLFDAIRETRQREKGAEKLAALSTDELISLSNEELFDAANTILYSYYDEGDIEKLSPRKRTALSLIRFDEEIQNGGLCQFFVNSSSVFATYVSDALNEVGALGIKALYDNFIKENNIDIYELSSFKTDNIDEYEAQTKRYPFEAFDDKYYELYEKENITELNTAYIRQHIAEIFDK